jgi:hypothetical protein
MVLLYRFMTGLWEPGAAASLLTFLTELEEESDLLDEVAILEPRRCFGVESMISGGHARSVWTQGKGQTR